MVVFFKQILRVLDTCPVSRRGASVYVVNLLKVKEGSRGSAAKVCLLFPVEVWPVTMYCDAKYWSPRSGCLRDERVLP